MNAFKRKKLKTSLCTFLTLCLMSALYWIHEFNRTVDKYPSGCNLHQISKLAADTYETSSFTDTYAEKEGLSNWFSVRNRTIKIFSGYIDSRFNEVILIGMSRHDDACPVSCKLKYADGSTKCVSSVSMNAFNPYLRKNPRHLIAKYIGVFYTFDLPKGELPINATLSNSNSCQDDHYNITLQRTEVDISKDRVDFTVCIGPVFEFKDPLALIEGFENNFYFGASKIVVYNHSMHPNISNWISSYVDEKKVEVIQWTVPAVLLKNSHYKAQTVLFNDCLYRYMSSTRYLIITDLDEVIVPHKHSSWTEMMNFLIQENPMSATFMFRNAFFQEQTPQQKNKTLKTSLNYQVPYPKVLKKLHRSKTIWEPNERSKMLVSPQKVKSFLTHEPGNVLLHYKNVIVDPVVGLLHHYRIGDKELIKDDHMLSHKEIYLEKYNERLEKLHKIGLL